MATVQEFGNLREISLAEGEVNRNKPDVKEDKKSLQSVEHDNENERKLKSNSLKRFFRMSHKKKTGEDDNVDLDKNQVELAKGENNLETDIQNPTQIGDVNDFKAKVDDQKSKADFRSFKLRLGGTKSNPKSSESDDKELAASFSRLTLKSSLSNYWNSVFKQKKNKKSLESTKADDDQENPTPIGGNENSNDNDSNFEEKVEIEEAEKTFVITPKESHRLTVVDSILSEEIHALKISEENVLE